jgi:hypothetical protein
MAFAHEAQRQVDLHEHVGVLRRSERGMREQTWFITAPPGCLHPSAPERGARLPTRYHWALRRHSDTSDAHAHFAQVCNPRARRSYA